MSKIRVESVSGKPFQFVMSARQHTAVTDAPVASGGSDTAMTPHEYFLQGLAGCIGMTIWMYAVRKKIPLDGVAVSVTEGRIDDPDAADDSDKGEKGDSGDTVATVKKKIPHLPVTIELEGPLTDEQVEALRTVAGNCPVYRLLTGKKLVEKTVTLKSTASPASIGEVAVTEKATAAVPTVTSPPISSSGTDGS